MYFLFFVLLAVVSAAKTTPALSGHWKFNASASFSTLESWSSWNLFISFLDDGDGDDAGSIVQVNSLFEPDDNWNNISAPLGGCAANLVTTPIFTPNPYMGLRFPADSTQQTCTSYSSHFARTPTLPKDIVEGGDIVFVAVDEVFDARGSTGLHRVHQTRTFALDLNTDDEGALLIVTISRESRPGANMTYAFNRALGTASTSRSNKQSARRLGSVRNGAEASPQSTHTPNQREAAAKRISNSQESKTPPFALALDDDWDVSGGLPIKALLLSLQGIANSDGHGSGSASSEPILYFLYPDDWDFTYTGSFFDYLSSGRPDPSLNVPFTVLPDMDASAALAAVAPYLLALADDDQLDFLPYVLWDPDVRDSLAVAYTVSGVEHALVLTQDTVGLARASLANSNSSLQLAPSPVVDLRGVFTDMSSTEIFAWAYEQYSNVTSRERVVMLGGDCEESYRHGVADYGIATNSFFMELSTDPASGGSEYELASEILAKQDNFSLLFGWHSYCKDQERTYTTLASQHTLRVEGLTTLPNFSFMTKKAVDPNFVFKNNKNDLPPHVRPPRSPVPPKTYVSCVQTDSLGLGSWLSPARGTIPYAWETPLNYIWLAPVILEFYYGTTTPNDLMIAAISGPGYNYPKAVPVENLPTLLAIAHNLTDKLDIDIMETMDDTAGDLLHGNADLTQTVVETYFEAFPEFTGFINGYGPASTFAESEAGQAFLSFDYYLSEYSSEAEATADIKELATLNRDSNALLPYFLLVHVREFSDISKVANVLAALPPEKYEVLPLDCFLRLAGRAPNFEENFAPY